MKFKNTEVFNFEGALRGMRNPMNSWDKSDSKYWLPNENIEEYGKRVNANVAWTPYHIGEKDMELAKKLIRGGSVHAKFLRQIMVTVDITAPLYWWKEFDTYKVGTVANSTSTMHKLATTPITIDSFEMDDHDSNFMVINYNSLILALEHLRIMYLDTKDIRYWKELIRWLPEGWLQTRTVTMNYENLRNMYHWRKNHKLIEWRRFCDEWIKLLPYAEEFITWEN